MKVLKIMNLSYGKNGARYAVVKEYIRGTRSKTLYIVAELPFFGNDNDMKLRADLLGSIAFKLYTDALEDYSKRLER